MYKRLKGSDLTAIMQHKGHRNFVIVLVDLDTGDLIDAKEMLPNATRIGDRFHFMSKIQDALDANRKAARTAEETKYLEVLNRSKFVLLKKLKKLTTKQKAHLAL